jgi:hypothetical protein
VTAIIDPKNVPDHLFSIPELDFSEDLFAEPLSGMWFRLGARTLAAHRDERGVESQILRASIALPPEHFAELFDSFDAVGHIFNQLGKPGGVINSDHRQKHYSYAPFHRFDFPFTSITGEPLVFVHSDTSHSKFIINPDIWLYLELEEKTPGTDIWWDPRRGIDVVSRRIIENGNLEIVETRSEYLLKYIKARQLSLLVCHFRRLLLFNPTQHLIDTFVKEDFNLGSPEQNAKTIVHNWGLEHGATTETQYLNSELHLWFEIKPPAIDMDAPWSPKESATGVGSPKSLSRLEVATPQWVERVGVRLHLHVAPDGDIGGVNQPNDIRTRPLRVRTSQCSKVPLAFPEQVPVPM